MLSFDVAGTNFYQVTNYEVRLLLNSYKVFGNVSMCCTEKFVLSCYFTYYLPGVHFPIPF